MVDIETFKRSADTFQKPQRGEYRHYFNGANFVMYFLEEVKAKKEGDEKMAANARHKYEMAVARLQAAAEIEVDPIYNENGNLMKVRVRVHNRRAGHALPTSLTNIREMWLEVVAKDASGKEILRSGFVNEEGLLDENTYVFTSDGMGHNMQFVVDPWELVSFSRHDVIPPKGFRDVYYTTMTEKKEQDLTFHVKLRFRQGNQKLVHKLLTNMPKGFDLTEIYGLTEVPTVPVVDMIDKTVSFSTKGTPTRATVQKKAEVPGQTFHDKLGGEAGISKAVDLFYDKVLADARVNYFFEGIDMATQRRMQKSFMNFAISGSLPYAGRDMQAAHAHLVTEKGLNDTHFDIIIEHFGAALKEMGVPDNLIQSAAAVANSVREDVLGRR
jgi:truncated hemoglobin YjbI